jgi:hypothetical protein
MAFGIETTTTIYEEEKEEFNDRKEEHAKVSHRHFIDSLQ